MTTVERYEYFEQSARQAIPAATIGSLCKSGSAGAIVGAGLLGVMSLSTDEPAISPVAIALGALLGVVIGLATNVGGIRWARRARADHKYSTRWAEAHGFTRHGDGVCPPNSPFRNSGDKPEPSELFEGQIDGIDLTFYNMTYVVEKGDRLGLIRDPVRHRFRVMRLIGPTLPVARFSLLKNGEGGKIEWRSELRDKLGPEHLVSLESAEFNRRFSLRIGAKGDEVGIRRVFGPAAIQSLVTEPFPFPCLLYYDEMWWTVEAGNYRIRDLDDWLPKQRAAIEAVQRLSRAKAL